MAEDDRVAVAVARRSGGGNKGGAADEERRRRRRPGGTTKAGGGTPQPQPHQQQNQQQQRLPLRWLKPRLRRRSRSSSTVPQEEDAPPLAAAAPSSSPSAAAASFPPLLRPSPAPPPAAATTTTTSDAAAAAAAGPPPSTPSPPLLLEQLALGAVGALTAALVTGLSALQLQQQLLGPDEAAAAANDAAAAAVGSLDVPVWRRTAAVSSSAGLGGFPLVLQPAAAPSSSSSSSTTTTRRRHPPAAPQRLLAVGTRYWGSGALGTLMKIKIYDFALYADASDEARRALRSAAAAASQLPPTPEGGLADALAASPRAVDVPATILLRAARDVPLSRLADEYERILRRRVAAALAAGGGDGDDDNNEPALRGLLSAFRDVSQLPASAVRFGSGGEPAVARGASLLFERLPGGRVLTRCIAPSSPSSASSASSSSSPADGLNDEDKDGGGDVVATLADVTSPVLARALFGLYLADQPVSQKAKDLAAESLGRLLLPPASAAAAAGRRGQQGNSGAASAPLYRARRGDRVVCELDVSPLDLEGGGHEHDACVLVPTFE